jgi:hypothetical protein
MSTKSISAEVITSKIFIIREQKVMIDRDLAELYGVETRVLNQAVRRNIGRFPEDFMFQLSKEETQNWVSQIVITNLKAKMGMRIRPLVFTEHGILMLSSVLKSERAVQVNIAIMRAFVRLREILSTYKNLAKKLEELENKYDAQFRAVFEAIRQLMKEDEKPKSTIGFQGR